MKSILLTGGTGFLGSHLLKTLINKGYYKIIVLYRSEASLLKLNKIFELPFDNYPDLHFCLISDNLEDIFKQNKIDVIIHTATEYGRENILPTEILKINLIFPLKLLELGKKYGLELFINTDTYFNKPNQTYKTLLDYSLSKKSLNLWLEYFSNYCKVVNLRLEHLFGDYDSNSKFCEHVIQKVAIEKVEELNLTNGEQKRDFVFVDDVCNAYIAVLNNYQDYYFKYVVCDVGTGKAISIKEFVNYVKNYSKSKTVINFGAIPCREDEIMFSVADVNFLKNWGLEVKYDYKKGIEKIIDIYMKEYKK